MNPSEVREKDVEDATGRDVSNLGIKIAGWALVQSELALLSLKNTSTVKETAICHLGLDRLLSLGEQFGLFSTKPG